MTIVMNGDKNIVAVFEKENYILTTSIQGLDIYSDGAATESYLQVTRSPNQNEYATGTQVTLSTINNLPNLWKFWGWCERNGDLFSTNATTTVTIDGNKDIEAVFKSPHSITKIYVNGYRTIEYDVKARDLMGFEKYLNGDITKSTFTGEIWIESLAIDANEALLKLCTIRVYINDKLIPLLTDKLTSPYRIKNNEGNLSFEISSGKSGNLRFFLDPAYITSGKFKIILDMPLRYQTVTGTIQ